MIGPEGRSDEGAESPAPFSLLHFSDYFRLQPSVLASYGAFDISLMSDLPLFIDPFLLFNSPNVDYQRLHGEIIKYLEFLRDQSAKGEPDPGQLKSWYYFGEVKQNWLGFTELGNSGHALGPQFAEALHANLVKLFAETEDEPITKGRHLEKVSLMQARVGRDCISDFTTNLIKEYLLDYTQAFAVGYLTDDQRRVFSVRRVRFNYETMSWQDGKYELPAYGPDFVLLTPEDILTRDDTWINHRDLVRGFANIPPAISDVALRFQVSNYFTQRLGSKPKQADRDAAAEATIAEYPVLLDYYIALKELAGTEAVAVSEGRVRDTESVFVTQLRRLIEDLTARGFYERPQTSYEEALARVAAFKQYVENQDGYKLINRKGQPFSSEGEVQLYFGLAMVGTTFDVNREPANGRGPVDFKLSKGKFDKSLIEFKLGKNTQLRRNLEKQVPIYEAANETKQSVTVIVNYTAADAKRVEALLNDLKLAGRENIVVIDARSDNKPSASKA